MLLIHKYRNILGGDYSYSGGGRGGSSSSSPKKSVKRERTDEETKEVLDHLLRDDVSNRVLCLHIDINH